MSISVNSDPRWPNSESRQDRRHRRLYQDIALAGRRRKRADRNPRKAAAAVAANGAWLRALPKMRRLLNRLAREARDETIRRRREARSACDGKSPHLWKVIVAERQKIVDEMMPEPAAGNTVTTSDGKVIGFFKGSCNSEIQGGQWPREGT